MLVMKKMKKSLKLLLIHKGIYLKIQALLLKIIFQDLKICDLSRPICPKLSPRFLSNIIVEDISKTFLFNITVEDFPKIFQDFRFVCRLYSAEIFLRFQDFRFVYHGAEIFKIFPFSIIAEIFFQDFQDLSVKTTVL